MLEQNGWRSSFIVRTCFTAKVLHIRNLNANPDGIIWNFGSKFYENILDSQFHSDTSHESHIGLILRVEIECYLLNWLSFKSESSNGSNMQPKKGSKNMLNNSTNQTAVFSMLLLEFCVQNVRDRNNIVCIILILYCFLELDSRVCIVPYHYWPTKYRSAAIWNSHHNGEIKLKPIASSRWLKNGFTKNINHKQVQSALIIIIYCIHWWKR